MWLLLLQENVLYDAQAVCISGRRMNGLRYKLRGKVMFPKMGAFPIFACPPFRGYKGGWLLPLNRNTGNLGRGQDLQARVSSKDSTEGKTRRGRLNVSAIYFLISPCFCDSLKYRIWAFCFWLFQVPQEREQHLSKYIASTCSSLFAAKWGAQSCHCSSPRLAAGWYRWKRGAEGLG